MAYLNLNTLEPVNFGGKECTPQINAETKLRLSQITKYDTATNAVLASAFPDDEEYVKDFLGNMTVIDVQILHAYLMGGPTMVESIKSQMAQAMKLGSNENE